MPARRIPGLLLLLCILGSGTAEAQKPRDSADPTVRFFAQGAIPRIHIRLAPDAEAQLREKPREWARCVLVEDDSEPIADVAIKLKGAAGSFRDYDDRPALTIRVDRFGFKERRFHGMEKFHLNNSVQDDSFLNEYIGSEVFRAAGLAATLVTHARLTLNDRDMGLYVLKEGFDAGFLRRNFGDASGNLYDGGFCQDVDADLEKDRGSGPDDRSDLKALAAACAEKDLVRRWSLLEGLVDVDRFLTFIAVELIIGHWDGYSQNRNNFRLLFDATSGKAVFIPHGMDQILADPEASILDMPTAMVARSVMQNPAWRSRYRKRIGELLPAFSADRLGRKVDEVHRRLTPLLEAIDSTLPEAHAERCADLKRRLAAREKNLKEQRSQPEPKPLVFVRNQAVKIGGWHAASEVEDAKLSEEKSAGEKLLLVGTGPSGRCIAGFRRSVLLSRGRYRFQASVKVSGVEALAEEGAPGRGAGLRLSGAVREEGLLGSGGWKALSFEFEVEEEARDVELVFELRASSGRAICRLDSLKLVRL